MNPQAFDLRSAWHVHYSKKSLIGADLSASAVEGHELCDNAQAAFRPLACVELARSMLAQERQGSAREIGGVQVLAIPEGDLPDVLRPALTELKLDPALRPIQHEGGAIRGVPTVRHVAEEAHASVGGLVILILPSRIDGEHVDSLVREGRRVYDADRVVPPFDVEGGSPAEQVA